MPVAAAPPDSLQEPEHLFRGIVAEFRKLLLRLLLARSPYLVRFLFGFGENLLELELHPHPVGIERGQKSRVIGKTHRLRNQSPVVGIFRDRLRLGIVQILQPVFQIAQEDIGIFQVIRGIFRKHVLSCQQIEYFQGGAYLEIAVAPPPDQLEDLRNELDFPDASRTQLDIVAHFAPSDLLPDLVVQFAHGTESAEIEVFPVYEGVDDFHQVFDAIPRNRPGLDPGIALPLSSLRQEIIFQHGKARNQRATFSIRPETHVDPEHETVLGQLIQA